MYEVAVIAILREQKADYGLQRIYASIGGMISSPLSGMLIDYASQGKGYTDFRYDAKTWNIYNKFIIYIKHITNFLQAGILLVCRTQNEYKYSNAIHEPRI